MSMERWSDDGMLLLAKRMGVRSRSGPFHDSMHVLWMRGERTFAWKDTFKWLLCRFEGIQHRHYGMKMLACMLIDLRKFCDT
jgi:hypothetical protein